MDTLARQAEVIQIMAEERRLREKVHLSAVGFDGCRRAIRAHSVEDQCDVFSQW